VVAAPASFDTWLAEAEAIAERERFFHWELEFPEVFFDRHGRSLGEAAGFDVVVGNPPYIRQEQLAALKPALARAYPAVYDGVADLYVYFYALGLDLLAAGGRISYIVTNKWQRAGYGAGLRGLFAARARIERLVDFGHAPIFEDADTFPCIIVLQKAAEDWQPTGDDQTLICLYPREALDGGPIGPYIAAHGYPVPMRRFTAKPWSLETTEVDDLMSKIRDAGEPLRDLAGIKPLLGLKTGLNAAYLIDGVTREGLISDDPACSSLIFPYLRGQDMARWQPDWEHLWLIILKSSENATWPWSSAGDNAETIFKSTYPSLHAHLKPFEAFLRKR
jgi:hypothetical protein